MNLYTIDTGYFKLDGGAMFGVVPKTIWQNLHPADANNLCTWAMRCLLIEKDNQLILIDTGLGDKQSEKFFSYYEPHGDANLKGSIQKAGFSMDDITDVVLTHLHFDHCGGAVEKISDDKFRPTFKNANYWSHSKHWEWAIKPNAREKASFLTENFVPLEESGQLRFLDHENPFEAFIQFREVSGHTESMIIPQIDYQGKTICYMADLLPSQWHIPIPYVMAYDTRPLLSLDEKSKFLDDAVKNNFILFFEHDRDTECAKLCLNDRGKIVPETTFRLRDL